MTRRKLGTILAVTGILVAILAVHTMDAVVIRALPAPPETETAALPTTEPAEPAPPAAAVAPVTMPPPPALSQPVTPLSAKSQPTPAPRREITPLTAEARPPAPEPTPPPAVMPLAAKPAEPAKIAPPVEPLTPIKPMPRTETPELAPDPAEQVPEKTIREAGRPLLRLLEHGTGPILEIAWPADRRARSHLHRLFSQCYGMRVALLDTDGRLFDADSPRGTPWAINTDRFSGFIRQSTGGIPLDERQTVLRIRGRHGLGAEAAPVRIFPRRADALLLGGLSHLVGPDYMGAKRIQAAYRLAENRVRIDTIRVDGRAIDGAIDLTRAARRGCIL